MLLNYSALGLNVIHLVTKKHLFEAGLIMITVNLSGLNYVIFFFLILTSEVTQIVGSIDCSLL